MPPPISSLRPATGFFSLLCLISLSACSSPDHPRTESGTPRATSSRLLTQSLTDYYRKILGNRVDGYFQNYPEIGQAHTKKLKEFVSAQCPLDEFVRTAASLTNAAPYQRAEKSFFYRHSEAFGKLQTENQGLKWIPLLGDKMQRWRGVYVARHIDHDLFREQLYLAGSTSRDIELIDFFQGEIAVDQLNKYTDEFADPKPGDRFFYYDTPASYWEGMMGSEGFVQIRDFQIIKVVTRLSN